jgi:hypothetical protein
VRKNRLELSKIWSLGEEIFEFELSVKNPQLTRKTGEGSRNGEKKFAGLSEGENAGIFLLSSWFFYLIQIFVELVLPLR